ncbi:hypothetical protein SEA_WEISS13_57 [Mycobacterium phage Weiss13]|nr:hypothetical protein SEA_WEISS13_57 [Mycobacterium phage Weiss13]ARW57143.1 hypothetical protein SEA_ZENON_58 [Mycobacterium phage Zenon]AVO21456.1 hypothetical protein PBI_NILO_59 [Mycobacterium phage Nilo]AYQ98631.1 hypothetical protein SEA_RIPARIAN_59 [Mycobacterium phage Riparian]
MRVADAVRKTSGIHRLKVGEMFTDADGDWEVTREPVVDGDWVVVYLRPVPFHEGQRARAYRYPLSTQVKMLRK